MKIIVTGCKGQLGTEIIKQLREGRSELGPLPEKLMNATVIPVDLPELDITNYKMVDDFIRRQRPDVIINCAAFTNVDGCEVNHDAAFKANAIGPRNLAQAATKTGARLVHVSTDYVFSGRENGGIPQDEATIPGPISAYGSTKLMGEKYVEQFCHRHFIVRTAWLYIADLPVQYAVIRARVAIQHGIPLLDHLAALTLGGVARVVSGLLLNAVSFQKYYDQMAGRTSG